MPRMIPLAILLLCHTAANAQDLHWEPLAPWPTSAAIRDVASDGSRFVAVTSSSHVLVSDGGAVWRRLPVPLSRVEGLNGVTWTGDAFVAVGYQGVILRSSDGLIWTSEAQVAETLYTVTACNDTAVAAGIGVVGRHDGGTWAPISDPPATTFFASACNGRVFVLVGRGVSWSRDGVHWTEAELPIDDPNLQAVTWTGDAFVAPLFEAGHSRLLTSADGQAWRLSDVPELPPWALAATTVTGRLVVAGGDVTSEGLGQNPGWIASGRLGTPWTVTRDLDRVPIAATTSRDRAVVAGTGGLIRASRFDGGWQPVDGGALGEVLGFARDPWTEDGSLAMTVVGGVTTADGPAERIWRSADGVGYRPTWMAAGPPIRAIVSTGAGSLAVRDPSVHPQLLVGTGLSWHEEESPAGTAELIAAAAASFHELLLVTWNGSRPAVHVRSGLEGPWRTTILDTNRRPLAAAAIGAESGAWIVVGEGGLVALNLGDDTWSVSTLGPEDDPPDLLAVSANERSILVGGTSGFVAQAGPSLVWSVGSLPIPESVVAISPGAGATLVSSPPPGSSTLTTSTVWRHAGGQSWQPLPRLPTEIEPVGIDGVLLWSRNGLAVLGVTEGFAPYGFDTTIDAAAHLDGARGTRWRTDLRLLNPWRQWGLVRVSGTDDDDPAVLVRIPPGAEAGLDDVVGSWFGRDHWSGPLSVSSDRAVVAVSRTSTAGPDGTHGQGIHGRVWWSRPPDVQVLPMLREDARFRSNLGIRNPARTEGSVDVELVESDGARLGPVSVAVGTPPWTQELRIARRLTSDPIPSARLEVSGNTSLRTYPASLSVIDNLSGDASFFRPLEAIPTEGAVLGAVAHTDGLDGASWRSDLTLVDLDGGGARVRLEVLPAEGWRGPVGTGPAIDLPPAGGILLPDVAARTLGGEGAAALLLRVEHGRAGAASRTFAAGPRGTYGQAIAPPPAAEIHPGLPQWLAGVEESRRFRSNLGLVNPGDIPLDVEIEAITDAGESLGTVAVTVPPRSLRLLSRIVARFTGGSFRGSLRTALLGAARPWQVWASVVDAQSGDPVFVHSAAVPEGP